MPAGDLIILNAINLIDQCEPGPCNVTDQSVYINGREVVGWENLRLEPARRVDHATLVVAKVPCRLEQVAGRDAQLHDLGRRIELGLGVADACHGQNLAALSTIENLGSQYSVTVVAGPSRFFGR